MLTVGSLFSGIGGFDLGFERVGMRVAWQVERDPWARQVLATHWPEVPKYDDICTVHAGAVPRVDLLCGGFPCQDISFAGKGAGIEGQRSGLWAEFARLVGELRPRYVVVENVSALRSRGLGRVLGDLAACGYDAEWDCIPASAVGAPHRRDRIWIVAYPQRPERRSDAAPRRVAGWDGVRPEDGGQGASGPRGDGEDVAHPHRGRQQGCGERHGGATEPGLGAPQWDDLGGRGAAVADADRTGLPFSRDTRAAGGCAPRIFAGAAVDRSDWWATEPQLGRVAHGVPLRVDRLRGLGNALVPQIASWIGTQILADAQRQEGGVQ